MTRDRYRIYETEFTYFMTYTIVGWLPIVTRPEAVDILLNSWRHFQARGAFKLYGYVVLENRLHLVASSPSLEEDVKNFKSYTARKIVDLLKLHKAEILVRQLAAHRLRHTTDSEYQVSQEGSHPIQIQNDEMMIQKLDYAHYNPVKRGYVDEPAHWRYSSARNYFGMSGLIEVVTDWRS